jgi:heterotetrameric sarcosine oxidase delta subunit
MFRINCPFCGERNEDEFHCGDESHITRPQLTASDDEWSNYLFNRTNPKGIHYERWCHSYGCNQWFNIARDTVTHEIHAIYLIDEPKPELLL